ncbi:metallophosphoesterase family protein [Pseudoxanthomonas putridarboris]|uniref:Metallophosphoesterase family protein n=1 Tax=Pseudoxanthomonas putridarboris TaxID=752605 RepID=A0ABU9J3G2_9GAMM
MRIGLLADLHANREAVEACLSALVRADCTHWVFLGDLVGYGADPGWVVDIVRTHVRDGAVAVLGNHDQAIAHPGDRMHEQALAAIDWTRTQLDASQQAFLAALPLQVEEEDRLYVHANAWDPAGWSYVASRLAATHSLSATTAWLTFCGHVHDPALYFSQPGDAALFQPQPGVPIPLATSRRWLAIPGACGQPRDGNPAAACAWLDTANGQLCFLRVPYDHERAAAKIRAASLPDAFAQRLLTGT